MYYTALLCVVITSEEVIVRRGCKVGGCLPCVLVPGDISCLLHGNTVEYTVSGNRESDAGLEIVEVNVCNVLGEEDLVVLVNRNCRIFPPQERVSCIGTVVEAHSGFKVLCIRLKHDAYHTLHSIDRVMLGKMACNCSVRILLNGVVAGHITGCTVVEGPVELNAARNPRAKYADKCGLDNVLLIEEVVSCGLVECAVYSAADLGEYFNSYVIVFKNYDSVLLLNTIYTVYCGNDLIGIGIAT